MCIMRLYSFRTLMLILLLVFLCSLVYLFYSLDKLEPKRKDCNCLKTASSAAQGLDDINELRERYEAEIEMLQDRIRVLQTSLMKSHTSELNGSSVKSSSMSEECLSQISFHKKVEKVEVLHGKSYPSENHINPFVHFDLWHQYDPRHTGNRVTDKVNGYKRAEVDEVIDSAVSSMNMRSLYNVTLWRRDQFTDGIYRDTVFLGTHYDLTFVSDTGVKVRSVVFRPQAPAISISHKLIEFQQKINIIVPLTISRKATFLLFLNNLEQILLKRRDVFLTLVIFGESHKEILGIFHPFVMRHKFNSYNVNLITDRSFSRGYALDQGVKSWRGRSDPLLFLCDVDVIFSVKFIDHCIKYAQKNSSVYYPIVFSLYNPEVIEHYFNQKFPSWRDQLKVTPDHGFWRTFGYGMACMYKSDYTAIGGFNLDIKGWGQEDKLLFKKFAQSNMTVYRASDPEIYHLWHHKTCNSSLSDNQYRDCIKTKALNEGSQLQLGYMLLKDEIKQRRQARERL